MVCCGWQILDNVNAFGSAVLKALTTQPAFLQIVYNIDAVKTNVPEALEILADSVLNPAFLNWEVRDALARLKEDLKEIEGNPQTMLLEVGVVWGMLACCGGAFERGSRSGPPLDQAKGGGLLAVVMGVLTACSLLMDKRLCLEHRPGRSRPASAADSRCQRIRSCAPWHRPNFKGCLLEHADVLRWPSRASHSSCCSCNRAATGGLHDTLQVNWTDRDGCTCGWAGWSGGRSSMPQEGWSGGRAGRLVRWPQQHATGRLVRWPQQHATGRLVRWPQQHATGRLVRWPQQHATGRLVRWSQQHAAGRRLQ